MNRPEPHIATGLVIETLRQRFGERLSTAQAVRDHHGKDLTWNASAPPDAVLFAQSTHDVQIAVELCNRYRVPVIPYGTGTSLEGHITAPQGGITVDLNGLNRVIEINADDLDCRVQAGVTRKQLNLDLRDKGLFFPIDPGADASIGGMAATRASGTNAVRYGTMKDNVLSLTAVMPNGEIIKTGGRARKSSAGYDLTRLLVGSEGTLGVITEITLKLQGIPQAIRAGFCTLPSVENACKTTIETIQMGIPIARIELLDAEFVKALNAYSNLGLPVSPILFVEFHGTDTSVMEQSSQFVEIASGYGAAGFSWAEKEEDRTKLWQARHDAFWAAKALMQGCKEAISTDLCVPISRLADCVTQTQEDLREHQIYGPIIGHVGDGNFHVAMFCDPADTVETAAVKDAYDRMVDRALSMGGTCTGEHGIGSGKRKYLFRELGPAVPFMQAIKRALDPNNIMNPGKNAGYD
jgi:D-lactate dehydrogenase (cytochrome)